MSRIKKRIYYYFYSSWGNNKTYKGLVKDVIEYPQSFYLKIETEKKEVLVPFIKEFVIEVSDSIIVDEITPSFIFL